jgi:hypothetical protein
MVRQHITVIAAPQGHQGMWKGLFSINIPLEMVGQLSCPGVCATVRVMHRVMETTAGLGRTGAPRGPSDCCAARRIDRYGVR